MLLDGGKAADALVVSEGLIIGGHQADDRRLAHFLQHTKTNMAVEKDEGSVLPRCPGDHRRFDQASSASKIVFKSSAIEPPKFGGTLLPKL